MNSNHSQKPKIRYEGHLQISWAHFITPSRNFLEVRWRSLFRSTSLGKRWTSYNAPPTSRKRDADRWSLRNFLRRSSIFMAEKAQKSHGARYELNSVFDLGKVDMWTPLRTSVIQCRSRPMRFLGFSNHEKGAPRQEISKWSTVCSIFSRSEWSVVRSASLAKGGTSKKRPSLHLHEVPTPSNNVCPRTLQTALVQGDFLGYVTSFPRQSENFFCAVSDSSRRNETLNFVGFTQSGKLCLFHGHDPLPSQLHIFRYILMD
jgi:hypothetical protein